MKNKGYFNRVIEHLENTILKLKEKLYLDATKKIAKTGHQIVADFY